MNEICLSCKKHTKCGRAIHETIGCWCYAPMTNEEWFCSLSTEEKAKWITENLSVYADEWVKKDDKLLLKETWERWLQEEHQTL